MKRQKTSLLIIAILTALAVIIGMPEGLPIQMSVGPIQIHRVTAPPHFSLPFFGIDRTLSTRLGLDLQGGSQLILEAQMQDVAPENRSAALESVREIVDRRVNFFGVSEPNVQTAQVGESHRVIVELPGIKDVAQAVDLLGQTARLEFREFTSDASTSAFLPLLSNTQSVGIDGKDLKKAELAYDTRTGEPIVAFEMTKEGAQKFGDVTKRLVGKRLAIFLDDSAISAPVVQVPITEGSGSITGGFTQDQAKQLALQLSAGALPVPIQIIEQKTIGASLGSQSVAESVRAGAIGLIMVAIFMVLYYRGMGILAVSALVIYGLLSFALFRLIPVTLTLPGIAGFILSIGMAVDSNILIFERMKEELRKGKSWQLAMELGFGKAWDSIRDANFTTLLTAFILYNPLNWNFLPTSGMVRGFALTLALGVIVSLFTGIVVTRTLMRAFYRPDFLVRVRKQRGQST